MTEALQTSASCLLARAEAACLPGRCPAWYSQETFLVQMPDDAADPAQDPNNQGEDEFEEAELERPDFEEKVGALEKFKDPSVKEESKEKLLKVTDIRAISRGQGEITSYEVGGGRDLKDSKENILFLDGSILPRQGYSRQEKPPPE